MDRNSNNSRQYICPQNVALRKESVDRNSRGMSTISYITASLSARRAWIEIQYVLSYEMSGKVALRKESVDRNTQRRDFKALGLVALRKESVDRNALPVNGGGLLSWSLSARRAWIEMFLKRLKTMKNRRRSPQGERG